MALGFSKKQIAIKDVVETYASHHPEANPDDGEEIELAFEFAEEAHNGQDRKSGDPYISHPLHVAMKLADINMDLPTIIAGLLHDVPEDTSRTVEDLQKAFGKEVAMLVAGVTKLGKIKYRGVERYTENLRRMFIAMAEDIRVIIIKFADRIHNLETLDHLPREKGRRIALESLEIYAPIANRLGIGRLRDEIEDLAFRYAYPDEYKWAMSISKEVIRKKEKILKHATKEIHHILKESDIHVESIDGRVKHMYSLYKKLLTRGRDISQIYDLVALRIVVESVHDCYAVLGLIHERWKPLKGRIKDYIAVPKPNGYQSLHTTVFCEGEIVEFQVRTVQMHQEAEYGIASHWNYTESGKPRHGAIVSREKLAWLTQLVKLQEQATDERQYLESLKIDIFKNRIFVFTPKGDVIDLPEDSTPVDFAYHIHTDVGHKCGGAKINDQMAALSDTLKSGDIVEILVDKNRKGPSVDWLEIVKTHTARDHIRGWLNKNSQGFFGRFRSKRSPSFH